MNSAVNEIDIQKTNSQSQYLLEIIQEPPHLYYNQDIRSNRSERKGFEVKLRVIDSLTREVYKDHYVVLNVRLLYEKGNMPYIATEDLIEVISSKFDPTEQCYSMWLHLKECSSKHNNQKFRLEFAPNINLVSEFQQIVSVISSPILVKSKNPTIINSENQTRIQRVQRVPPRQGKKRYSNDNIDARLYYKQMNKKSTIHEYYDSEEKKSLSKTLEILEKKLEFLEKRVYDLSTVWNLVEIISPSKQCSSQVLIESENKQEQIDDITENVQDIPIIHPNRSSSINIKNENIQMATLVADTNLQNEG